jgi:copper chaperone
MYKFQVPDMTCGHCASTIMRSIISADNSAKVDIDLAEKFVTIEPTETNVQELHDAISEAGYSPTLYTDASVPSKTDGSSSCVTFN